MRKFITLVLTVLLLCGLALPAHAVAVEQLSDEQGELLILDPKVEAMIAWAMETAADDTHGYSQYNRFGPSYDCSSFVSTALMEGGFGLDTYLFPANMVEVLPEYGFEVYERGETEPQRGDILVRPYVHVEICMGNGTCVSAHHDYDGRAGDSTGHEIEYRTEETSYCPFCLEEEYTYILRYNPDLAPQLNTISNAAGN